MVVRADGTPAGFGEGKDRRLPDRGFVARSDAETVATFLNATPDEYRITRSVNSWMVSGGRRGDPAPLDQSLRTDKAGTGGSPVTLLISHALHHAKGADARIAEKAECSPRPRPSSGRGPERAQPKPREKDTAKPRFGDAWEAMDWAVRTHLADALAAAGLDDQAAAVRALLPLRTRLAAQDAAPTVQAAMRAAQDAARQAPHPDFGPENTGAPEYNALVEERVLAVADHESIRAAAKMVGEALYTDTSAWEAAVQDLGLDRNLFLLRQAARAAIEADVRRKLAEEKP
ncbi:hypothetical protein GCM10022254_10180 [Actinomadura meridiana]|uniref:Uncharacterized protein n=1 Tax=Actinomadura meridiana TaxID=559626 RepID=A0ABP8BU67_9ACTN